MADAETASNDFAFKKAKELHADLLLNPQIPCAKSFKAGAQYTAYWGASQKGGIWFYVTRNNGQTIKDWLEHLASLGDVDVFGEVRKPTSAEPLNKGPDETVTTTDQ